MTMTLTTMQTTTADNDNSNGNEADDDNAINNDADNDANKDASLANWPCISSSIVLKEIFSYKLSNFKCLSLSG